MLTKEDNELLCRVEGAAPMGRLMRRHWTPVCLLEEVAEPDGAPVRAQRLDGQPRLAALWLAGAADCPVLPVWTNLHGLGQDGFALFDEAEGHEGRVMEALAAEVLAQKALA